MDNYFYYTCVMPNQPAKDTVTVSFTLPYELNEAVERKASREITNKSDIIRRALMNHISPEERARVLAAQQNAGSSRYPKHVSNNYLMNEEGSSSKVNDAFGKVVKKSVEKLSYRKGAARKKKASAPT